MGKASRRQKAVSLKKSRQVQRVKHGKLGHNLVSQETLVKYTFAMKVVLWFMCTVWETGLPRNFCELDDCISELLEQLWHDGEGLHLGEQVLAGTQHFLKCEKGRLKQSGSLMTVWRRLEPPKRTPPWSQKLLLAIVGVCLSMGWER